MAILGIGGGLLFLPTPSSSKPKVKKCQMHGGVFISPKTPYGGKTSSIPFLYATAFRYKVTQRTHKCPGKLEADLKYQKETQVKGMAPKIVTCNMKDCYDNNILIIFLTC